MLIYLISIFALFGVELLYLKVAVKHDIVDKPNLRGSHNQTTIRGGGIIFYIAALLYFISSGFTYPSFFVGLSIVAVVSFIDDLHSLTNWVRLFAHFMAVGLIIYGLNLFSFPVLLFLMALIVAVGIINAVNFMDGINGMTGGYSLVCLGTLWFINNYLILFVDNSLIIFLMIGLLVFNFFNFRKKARCFAGDVGSVSIAFVMVFLTLKLAITANSFIYILLLSVYGVDTVLTIIHRLLNKENIFKAHRLHLYQVLVNDKGFSHIKISSIYMGVQLAINFILIIISEQLFSYQLVFSGIILTSLSLLYIYIKQPFYTTYTEGKDILIYNPLR